MPRWVEAVGLFLVALVVVGAILVWARMSTREAQVDEAETQARLESARKIPSLPPGLLDGAAPQPNGPSVEELRRVLDRAAPSIEPPVLASASPVEPPVPGAAEPSPTAAVDTGIAGALPGDTDVIEPPVLEDVVEPDDAASAEDATVEDETVTGGPDDATQLVKVVDVGAVQKLTAREEAELLGAAHASLERLYALRLRTDVPPVSVELEAARLREILNRLPDDQRAEISRLLDSGYRALPSRAAGGPAVGSLDGPGGNDPSSSGLDAGDRRPNDVRALGEAARAAQRRAGAPPPAPPAALPAAAPAPLEGVGASPL